MPSYKGPRDASKKVTPNLLFRGDFLGETVGPYISQFIIQDTSMGALPLIQKYTTVKKGVDFMLDKTTFLQVQNGIPTGLQLHRTCRSSCTTDVGWAHILISTCCTKPTLRRTWY